MEEMWELLIFTNIARSEQHHMDAVKKMLDKYGLTDPVGEDDLWGVFQNDELNALFESLMFKGSESLMAGLYVGAEIEEIDLIDIEDAILRTNPDHTDIIKTYEILLCGARNHLRAFVKNIELRGDMYESFYLTPDQLAAILDNPADRNCGNDEGKRSRKGSRSG